MLIREMYIKDLSGCSCIILKSCFISFSKVGIERVATGDLDVETLGLIVRLLLGETDPARDVK